MELGSELLRGSHVSEIVHVHPRNSSLEFNAGVNLHFQPKQQNAIMAAVRLFYYGDEIKEDEMVWARGVYGGEENCIQDFLGET